MNKTYRVIALCFLLSLIPLAIHLYNNSNKQEHLEPTILSETTYIPPTPSPEEELLQQMTTEEKVGQLFIFTIDGIQTLDQATQQFLSYTHPGGIILFQKNIQNENQLKSFITLLQSTNKIPMFIAIDQEGGTVHRLEWNETLTLPPKLISTPQQAYALGVARGKMLHHIGINMNLAPVVEYTPSTNSFIYPRTFNGDIYNVVEKSTNMINGYKTSQIISVPKHFPGHGDGDIDPHEGIVSVNIPDTQWNEYIKPFSMLLLSSNIDAIMIGHIMFPNIDKYPASLSYEIITNRLIKELNYNGIVISDAMEMKSISKLGTQEQIALQALSAGEDILIYSQYSEQSNVYDYILQQVKQGTLNIDEKVKRILRLKMQYNILNPIN